MRHFILASHGTFSRGIYNSVQIILGEQPNTHIITAYVEEGQDVNDLIEKSLKIFQIQILLLYVQMYLVVA